LVQSSNVDVLFSFLNVAYAHKSRPIVSTLFFATFLQLCVAFPFLAAFLYSRSFRVDNGALPVGNQNECLSCRRMLGSIVVIGPRSKRRRCSTSPCTSVDVLFFDLTSNPISLIFDLFTSPSRLTVLTSNSISLIFDLFSNPNRLTVSVPSSCPPIMFFDPINNPIRSSLVKVSCLWLAPAGDRNGQGSNRMLVMAYAGLHVL
jgi:hypothetical protein